MKTTSKRFRGYSFKELRYRQVVNSAKQQQVKAGIDDALASVRSLKNALSSKHEYEPEEKRHSAGLLSKVDTLIEVGNYAVAGVSLFRSVKQIFGKK
ncbi:MAG: hypothetical protein K2O00_04415 [Muribaculaceae bacterium]|nr:hypothetical protein [Muribaculaceae bacterium]